MHENPPSGNTSKAALESFLETQILFGEANPNTVGSWRAAVRKILADVAPDADVSSINVDALTSSIQNSPSNALRQDSLRVYGQRAKIAIQEFLAYTKNPDGYKLSTQRTKVETIPISQVSMPFPTRKRTRLLHDPESPRDTPSPSPQQNMQPSESALDIPFPLRPDFLAQVKIPRDLSKQEAERLCAFIKALAQEQ
ncbi:hypothetical protein [Hydrogenophaga luteola]|uniref:Uncharacterized protein n=1 Tax=Hydrogenophaga luteola TaxID=1591122 RepID=A0ABV7W2B2_9BURK